MRNEVAYISEGRDMLEIGQEVRAEVSSCHPFGIYFDLGEDRILCLIPDISWSIVADPSLLFVQGETVALKIIRYDENGRTYVGSIRESSEVENPFESLTVGDVVEGDVHSIRTDDMVIKLDGGAVSYLDKAELPNELRVGARVAVIIEEVQPKLGMARCRLC